MMHAKTEFVWFFLGQYKNRLDILRQEGASAEFVTGALIALDWLAQFLSEHDDDLDRQDLAVEESGTEQESIDD